MKKWKYSNVLLVAFCVVLIALDFSNHHNFTFGVAIALVGIGNVISETICCYNRKTAKVFYRSYIGVLFVLCIAYYRNRVDDKVLWDVLFVFGFGMCVAGVVELFSKKISSVMLWFSISTSFAYYLLEGPDELIVRKKVIVMPVTIVLVSGAIYSLSRKNESDEACVGFEKIQHSKKPDGL